MAAQTETREQEIRKIWRDHRLFYKLLGAALLIGIGALLGRLIYGREEADQAWSYGVNIYTSVISTLVTVFILDQLAERRADRKAEEALKRQLVDDAASTSNEIAKNAVHQLRRKEWLMWNAGLLKGANLINANLRGANISWANLQGANLNSASLEEAHCVSANMKNAFLSKTKLQGAKLAGANLQQTDLVGAKLQGANLFTANLYGANLFTAHLEGTSLRLANLCRASLEGAYVDAKTILPDGEYWTAETDIERFTDPNHPDFWQPAWVKQQVSTLQN